MRIAGVAAALVLAGCSSLAGTSPGTDVAGAEICQPERWERIQALSTKPEVDALAREAADRYQAGDTAGCLLELNRAEYEAHEAPLYD